MCTSARCPSTTSGATSPPASRRTRPAPTASRATRRSSSTRSTAATPGSWACRCSTRPHCSRPSVTHYERAPVRSIEFLINFTPQESRVALVKQCVVQELHVERTASRGIVGNIYLGKVVRVLPGMQSAFIDIGLERTAFLHVADIWSDRQNGESARPIERILAEGQSLMVQVLKDPIGTKGARLSTQISLAGRLLVYLPQEKHIGISQRIENEAEREALRSRLTALVPEDERGGFIVRTMAESASDEELAADIAYLRKLWSEISGSTVGLFPPKVLHEDLSLGQRTLRDLVTDETSRIRVDSRENFQKLTAFAAEYTPQVLPLLEHYT